MSKSWTIESVSVQGANKGKRLLEDISCTILPGRITLIIGPNGAGKTTLLTAMAGLKPLSSGAIKVGNVPLWHAGKPNREALLAFGIALQRSEAQWFAPAIKDELLYSLRPYGLHGKTDEQLEMTLASVGLTNIPLQRSPTSLSGGEQRRLSWACIAASDPDWLLLDEPTAGLDPSGIDDLRRLLMARRDAGKGAVVVTHDLDALLPLADQVLCLRSGLLEAQLTGREEIAARLPLLANAAPMTERIRLSAALTDSGWNVPDDSIFWSAKRFADEILNNRQKAASTALSSSLETRIAPARRIKHEEEVYTPPDKHPWTDRDPRALWIAYWLLSTGIMLQSGMLGLAAAGIMTAIILTGLLSAIKPYKGMILFYVFFLLVVAAGAGLSGGFNSIGFHWEAARPSVFLLAKLLLVMLLGLPLLMLIPPRRLKLAIEQPLYAFKAPEVFVQSVSLVASLMLRFIPLMLGEWNRFAAISAARGKAAGKPGKVPLRTLHTVLIPYVLAMLQLADRIASVMEIRGFGEIKRARRPLEPLRFTAADAVLLSGSTLLLFILLILSRLTYP